MLEVLEFGHFPDFCTISPKSPVLTPQLAMPSFCFEPKYDIWSHCFVFDVRARLVIRERYFHVFSDCFWFMFPQIFWNWDIKVFADVPVDYFTNSVVSLCVQLF